MTLPQDTHPLAHTLPSYYNHLHALPRVYPTSTDMLVQSAINILRSDAGPPAFFSSPAHRYPSTDSSLLPLPSTRTSVPSQSPTSRVAKNVNSRRSNFNRPIFYFSSDESDDESDYDGYPDGSSPFYNVDESCDGAAFLHDCKHTRPSYPSASNIPITPPVSDLIATFQNVPISSACDTEGSFDVPKNSPSSCQPRSPSICLTPRLDSLPIRPPRCRDLTSFWKAAP